MTHNPAHPVPAPSHESAPALQVAPNDKGPPTHAYTVRIDDQQHRVPSPTLTRLEILALAGRRPPESHTVEMRLRGKRAVVCPCDTIDLTQLGLEHFVTLPGVAFFIDQQQVLSPTTTLTVREILATYAKVDPTLSTLVEKQGGKHTDLDEVLTIAPCARFTVYHNTPTTVS